jgi:hypothetical protein
MGPPHREGSDTDFTLQDIENRIMRMNNKTLDTDGIPKTYGK